MYFTGLTRESTLYHGLLNGCRITLCNILCNYMGRHDYQVGDGCWIMSSITLRSYTGIHALYSNLFLVYNVFLVGYSPYHFRELAHGFVGFKHPAHFT